MKTIVALVDFTDVTTRVLDMARMLATAMRSRVILLHVIPPMPVVTAMGGEAPIVPDLRGPEELALEKTRLNELLVSLTSTGMDASALQFEGPVVPTVMEEVQKLNADLVVMGSHHHTALYNFFIGSVAADLLKQLTFPVLVVPADMTEKEGEPVSRATSAEEVRQSQAVMQPVLSA